jgi:signal transduction histidine kinase/DNA-binding response OmpR family regulator/tetratricopeptide (TPR) repeat protein
MKLFTTILLCIGYTLMYAQQVLIDKADSAYVKNDYEQSLNYINEYLESPGNPQILLALGKKQQILMRLGKLEDAVINAHQYLDLSIRSDSGRRRKLALNDLAITHKNLGNYDSSVFYLEQVLRLSKKDQDTLALARAYNQLGSIHNNTSNYRASLEAYFQALKFNEALGREKGAGINYLNIGNIYSNLNEYDDALLYYKKSAVIFSALQEEFALGYSLSNIGNYYLEYKEYKIAENYFKESLAIRKKYNDQNGIRIIQNNLGLIKLKTHQPEEAIRYFKNAIDLGLKMNMRSGLAFSYGLMGEANAALENHLEAIKYSEQSIEIYQELGNNKAQLVPLQIIAQSHEKLNNFSTAYEKLSQYLLLKDSVFSLEKQSEINYLALQKEKEERLEKEKALAEQRAEIQEQTFIQRLGILSAFFFLIISGLLYRQSLIRKKQKDQALSDKAIISSQSIELKKNQELKSRFFANISHELRTPLTLILGEMERLLTDRKYALTEVARHKVKNVTHQAKKLKELIDDILDLSKLEVKRWDLRKKLIRVDKWAEHHIQSFHSLAEIREIHLSYTSSIQDPVYLFADLKSLEKIINNILSNALKFTPANKEIAVITSVKSQHFVLCIQDQGPGIPEKDQKLIFDRFYQASNQVQSDAGTGLGLAIAKELVALHEGTISLRSSPQGTNIEIKIPLVPMEEIKMEERMEKETEVIPFKPLNGESKPSILLVEDHSEIATFIQETLEDQYHIIHAAHGAEALKVLKKQLPSLVICDLMMPVMDGFEFLSVIKKDLTLRSIPVIMLTARNGEEDRLNALQLGVDDYLTKPFNSRELSVRVYNLLHNLFRRIQTQSEQINTQELVKLDNDDGLVEKMITYVEEHIDRKDLHVEEIARHLAMSERQLYRKIGAQMGFTPAQLIREVRLRKAYNLLQQQEVIKMSELSHQLGFESPSYFSRIFLKRFGKRPTEMIRSVQTV